MSVWRHVWRFWDWAVELGKTVNLNSGRRKKFGAPRGFGNKGAISAKNVQIYDERIHQSSLPLPMLSGSVPIFVPSSVWIPIPFPVFIAACKLTVVVSRTLAALPDDRAWKTLAKRGRKPATHPGFPSHTRRRTHHWVKRLARICGDKNHANEFVVIYLKQFYFCSLSFRFGFESANVFLAYFPINV